MGKVLTQPELAAIRQRVADTVDADQACRDRAALLAHADELWGAIVEIGTNTYRMNHDLRAQIAKMRPLVAALAMRPNLRRDWGGRWYCEFCNVYDSHDMTFPHASDCSVIQARLLLAQLPPTPAAATDGEATQQREGDGA